MQRQIAVEERGKSVAATPMQRSRSEFGAPMIRREVPRLRRATPGILPAMVALDRVAALLDAGKSTAEIAAELRVDASTINRARAKLGRSGTVGRPETGERERVWIRVDDDTLAVLDEHAERSGSTRAEVAERVVTAWAQRSRNAQRR
jgi:hypothetical protein